MIAFDDSALRKPRARYNAAVDDMAAAVLAGGLLAAAHVAAVDSGSGALQVIRGQVLNEAISRRVVITAGRVLSATVLASLPGPWSPQSFDRAIYSVGQLLLTAWQARPGVRP